MDIIVFTCPHCGEFFIVDVAELNCRIVRHFVYRNLEQLNPHANQDVCEAAVKSNLGYGCAGPIRLVKINEKWSALKATYSD